MGTAVASGAPARVELRGSLFTDGRLVAVGIVAVLAVYVIVDVGHLYDDPYILLRYARNLLDGHGWTFNPSEVTANAATSTGYVLLLAALGSVGVSLGAASTMLFVAGMGAAAWFTFATYRGQGGAVAAALLLLSPQLVNTRGMETPIMLGLLAAAVWACRDRRDMLTGALLVAVAVVRPDAALLTPVLVLWRRIEDGAWPWRIGGIAVAGGAVYGTVLLATIGLPATLGAKIAQAASGLFPIFAETVVPQLLEARYWWAVVFVGLAANREWRQQPAVWLAALLVAAYATLGVAFYPWYWALPIYAAAVASGAGLERQRLAPLVLVAMLSFSGVSAGLTPERQAYREAGRWLANHTQPGDTVGASEIGIVGWESGRPIRSHLGLLNPGRADDLASPHHGAWLDVDRPDYLVINDWFFPIEASTIEHAESTYIEVYRSGPIRMLRIR